MPPFDSQRNCSLPYGITLHDSKPNGGDPPADPIRKHLRRKGLAALIESGRLSVQQGCGMNVSRGVVVRASWWTVQDGSTVLCGGAVRWCCACLDVGQLAVVRHGGGQQGRSQAQRQFLDQSMPFI